MVQDHYSQKKGGRGWGLKSLPEFAQALAAKQGWLLLKQNSLWAEVIHHKYIWPLTITNWIRRPNWNRQGISAIWKASLNAMPLIRYSLLWRIGNGSSVRIGIDPWSGSGNAHNLPKGLVLHSNNRGIKFLSQIGDQQHSTIYSQAWLTDRAAEDELIWAISKTGLYSPKLGYHKLIEAKNPDSHKSWWSSIWPLQAQPRTRLLMWNTLANKIPTGSNLMKRALAGPTWCVLCRQAEESTLHLFLTCSTTRDIWAQVIQALNINANWQGVDIQSAWDLWWNSVAAEKPRNLPLLVAWYIWIRRNAIIF
eukprot:PITA_20716